MLVSMIITRLPKLINFLIFHQMLQEDVTIVTPYYNLTDCS